MLLTLDIEVVTLQVRPTVPLNPLVPTTLIVVLVPLAPCAIETVGGEADSVKLGGGEAARVKSAFWIAKLREVIGKPVVVQLTLVRLVSSAGSRVWLEPERVNADSGIVTVVGVPEFWKTAPYEPFPFASVVVV